MRALLVLSGGAALGLSHLGVYRALAELGVEVAGVVGVSAGAITGALIAAGFPPAEVERFHRRYRWINLVRPELTSRLGALSYARMEAELERTCQVERIEQLSLPLVVCCTDVSTAQPVALSSGPLGRAVRASCSVPGLFSPVEFEGRFLVDGGIHSNLPLWATDQVEKDFDLIVASDPISRLRLPRRPRRYREVLQISFILVLKSTTEKVLPPRDPRVVLIQPEMEWVRPVDLGAIDRLMELGYQEAQRVLLPLLGGTVPPVERNPDRVIRRGP